MHLLKTGNLIDTIKKRIYHTNKELKLSLFTGMPAATGSMKCFTFHRWTDLMSTVEVPGSFTPCKTRSPNKTQRVIRVICSYPAALVHGPDGIPRVLVRLRDPLRLHLNLQNTTTILLSIG